MAPFGLWLTVCMLECMATPPVEHRLRMRRVLVLLISLLMLLASCESWNPWNRRTSAWHDCMEDAGYWVESWTSDPSESDLIVAVEILKPAPDDAMRAQSERCIFEVNGGVRVTHPPTTLPPGLAGVFVACMAEAGYEVSDVEIVVPEGGYGASGSSLSYGVNGPPIPEEVVGRCERELVAAP